MKNKQRNVRFALILAVLVAVCGIYLFSFKPQKTSRYVESGNIDDVHIFGDKNHTNIKDLKQYYNGKGVPLSE